MIRATSVLPAVAGMAAAPPTLPQVALPPADAPSSPPMFGMGGPTGGPEVHATQVGVGVEGDGMGVRGEGFRDGPGADIAGLDGEEFIDPGEGGDAGGGRGGAGA